MILFTENNELVDTDPNQDGNSNSLFSGAGTQGTCADTIVTIRDMTVSDEIAIIIHKPCMNQKHFINKLASMGIHVRTGKWNAIEDKILIENIKKFELHNPEVDLNEFFNIGDYDLERQKDIMKKKKSTRFMLEMPGNLNRTAQNCLNRAKAINPDIICGTYTEEEESQLTMLVMRYPGRWRKIGRLMGRIGTSCRDHWKIMEGRKSTSHSHRWSLEAEKCLINAIIKVMGSCDTDIIGFDLPYEKLEKMVKTRTQYQIRVHWLRVLSNRIKMKELHDINLEGNNPDAQKLTSMVDNWSVDNSIDLIQHLMSLDVQLESEIDWQEVVDSIGSTRTPFYVRSWWVKLRGMVQKHQIMCLQDILEKVMDNLDIKKRKVLMKNQ